MSRCLGASQSAKPRSTWGPRESSNHDVTLRLGRWEASVPGRLIAGVALRGALYVGSTPARGRDDLTSDTAIIHYYGPGGLSNELARCGP